jgi:hypothetical protein
MLGKFPHEVKEYFTPEDLAEALAYSAICADIMKRMQKKAKSGKS